MISPFSPHLAEELWQELGHKESISKTPWPKYEPQLVKEEFLAIAIQVNGKLRSDIRVPVDITDDALKEAVLSDEKVKKWIGTHTIKKFIIVPKRLVNIVV